MHILRHSAAKLRRDAGESIESVSQFLDHSNLATTTVYLRRLEGQTDQTWGKVAAAIGVKRWRRRVIQVPQSTCDYWANSLLKSLAGNRRSCVQHLLTAPPFHKITVKFASHRPIRSVRSAKIFPLGSPWPTLALTPASRHSPDSFPHISPDGLSR
jgi:hypothetical protein